MNGIEGLGLAAEFLSWIGPMTGLPLIVLAMILRATDRGMVPTQIVIVERPSGPRARWFTAEDIYERRLRALERRRLAGRDFAVAYVSPVKPALMSLRRRRPVTTACLSSGLTLAITGLCGIVFRIAQALLN